MESLAESGNGGNTLVKAPSVGKGISLRWWVNAGCSITSTALLEQMTNATYQTKARIVIEALRMLAQSDRTPLVKRPVVKAEKKSVWLSCGNEPIGILSQ